MAAPSLHVVVLGAGFGGLEIASRLAAAAAGAIEVTLIDKSAGFVFGFSKLDVMFGRVRAEEVIHPYDTINLAGVTFVSATITEIDPLARSVNTTRGRFTGDVLVIALGADIDPQATPGLVEAGHEFYTNAGAFACRTALAEFSGGHVVVGVTSTPFKCPPAPSEAALLVDDLLSRRGLRDQSRISLVMPFNVPVPPSPDASTALLDAFTQRGIDWVPNELVTSLDPVSHVATLSSGADVDFDLFLAVPRHCVPAVVVDAGLADDGWIAVDPLTLQTQFPDVYAVGDVASVGTPKAGVFAEGQGAVVASAILARSRGTTSEATYDGTGRCYLEFGHDLVARVQVTFLPGEAPHGSMDGPSIELAEHKVDFATSRIARWFNSSG